MTILCIILILIIFILLLFIFHYKRQVKNICRQLAFLKEHDSNMLISSDVVPQELNMLKNGINEVLKENKQQKKQYMDKEKNIAEIHQSFS